MKEISNQIKLREKELPLIMMVLNMKEITKIGAKMGKEFIIIAMEINMKANL